MIVRRGAVVAGLVATLAGAAQAQDARQIARARTGAACRGCNLFQADFAGRTLRGVDLGRARLRQADLSAAILTHAHLEGADLRDVDGFGVVLTGADLQGADLTNASLVGAYLQGANLQRTKLAGVNFSGADLTAARGLTPASLSRACGDASTRLPRGLALATCR